MEMLHFNYLGTNSKLIGSNMQTPLFNTQDKSKIKETKEGAKQIWNHCK
jgi:hypothetical protein